MPSLDPIDIGRKTATITKHPWKRVCAACYGLSETTARFAPHARDLILCLECLGESA